MLCSSSHSSHLLKWDVGQHQQKNMVPTRKSHESRQLWGVGFEKATRQDNLEGTRPPNLAQFRIPNQSILNLVKKGKIPKLPLLNVGGRLLQFRLSGCTHLAEECSLHDRLHDSRIAQGPLDSAREYSMDLLPRCEPWCWYIYITGVY